MSACGVVMPRASKLATTWPSPMRLSHWKMIASPILPAGEAGGGGASWRSNGSARSAGGPAGECVKLQHQLKRDAMLK
jgi:hypothetical protein